MPFTQRICYQCKQGCQCEDCPCLTVHANSLKDDLSRRVRYHKQFGSRVDISVFCLQCLSLLSDISPLQDEKLNALL